jgi:hypothetical protein
MRRRPGDARHTDQPQAPRQSRNQEGRGGIHYRIFKQDKTVSVDELTEKLAPIIDGLIAEGKKNMATMVPATVAMFAAKLKRLLDEWAE